MGLIIITGGATGAEGREVSVDVDVLFAVAVLTRVLHRSRLKIRLVRLVGVKNTQTAFEPQKWL